MSVHDMAARGFERAGDAYEKGRPSYPKEAVAFLLSQLGISERSSVVDLGAGTGKLTSRIAASGATVIAVEPAFGMLSKLAARSLETVRIVAGVAEAIPLARASVDGVVAGQAFHWFRGDETLAEIHRVLRPGGKLGLVWNRRDERKSWVAALARLVDQERGDAPRYVSGEWKRAFERTSLFSPLRQRSFEHVQRVTRELMRDRVASTSFVAALPDDERERLLREVEGLLDAHPDTRSSTTLELPYVAEVHTCERLGS